MDFLVPVSSIVNSVRVDDQAFSFISGNDHGGESYLPVLELEFRNCF